MWHLYGSLDEGTESELVFLIIMDLENKKGEDYGT